MLDERDLQAIKSLMDDQELRMVSMMDEKIGQSEARMTEKIEQSEARMTEKIEQSEARMTEKIEQSQNQIFAYMESAILPKFDLLVEGHETLLQTLAPRNRVEALEEEVSFLREVVKAHSLEIEKLKMAQ